MGGEDAVWSWPRKFIGASRRRPRRHIDLVMDASPDEEWKARRGGRRIEKLQDRETYRDVWAVTADHHANKLCVSRDHRIRHVGLGAMTACHSSWPTRDLRPVPRSRLTLTVRIDRGRSPMVRSCEVQGCVTDVVLVFRAAAGRGSETRRRGSRSMCARAALGRHGRSCAHAGGRKAASAAAIGRRVQERGRYQA